MTPELLSALTITLSALAAFGGYIIAARRLRAQNTHDESTAAESVSDAAISLIAPLRKELETTQRELITTRDQLRIVQRQLDDTVTALKVTQNDVMMSQSEIRLLKSQNTALLAQNAALGLRISELESENLRLHNQIDSR